MSIENKIKSLLEAVEKTPAQLSYPGATGEQDPAPVAPIQPTMIDSTDNATGVNTSQIQQAALPGSQVVDQTQAPVIGAEELEFDRPGVVSANVQQVQYPGQTAQDPAPIPAEFMELDPYNPAGDIVPNAEKESYPVGSGAEGVTTPSDTAQDDPENKFSADIKPAAHPAPFVAESAIVEGYTIHSPKNGVAGEFEGKIVVLDKTSASDVEKKLGLKKGALTAGKDGYSKTFVVKGDDGKLHTVYARSDKVRLRQYGHANSESTEQLKQHLNEEVQLDEATRGTISYEDGSGKIKSNYIHFGGDVKVSDLNKHFNSIDSAKSIVDGKGVRFIEGDKFEKYADGPWHKTTPIDNKVKSAISDIHADHSADVHIHFVPGYGWIKRNLHSGSKRQLKESFNAGVFATLYEDIEPSQDDILAQAVAAVQAGNDIEEVAKATGLDVQAIKDAIDAAKPTASPSAPVTTAPVSESAQLNEYFAHGKVNDKKFSISTPGVYSAKDIQKQNPHLSNDEAKAIEAHTETDEFADGKTHTSTQNGHKVTVNRNGGYAEDNSTNEAVTVRGTDTYQTVPIHRLKAGDEVHMHERGRMDKVKFNGWTDDDVKYGDGGPKFEHLKAIPGITKLGDIEAKSKGKEYGHGHYANFTAQDEGGQPYDFNAYVYNGKLSVGTGATPVTFHKKTGSTGEPATVNENQFAQDIDSLLTEADFSDEFKTKATSLFEAAVVARVNNEALRLEEAFNTKLAEHKQSLDEQYATATENFANTQAERLNSYINYLGEQWIKQNRVAVQTGVRAELTESFMSGLQKLFAEHYINAPQEKIDLVEEQQEQIAKLQESIEQLQQNIETLNEANQSLQRDTIIGRLSEGLTDTEVAKLTTLCEGISFETEELFEAKVEMVKKNFFTRKSAPSPEQLLEETVHVTQPQEELAQQKQVSPSMSAYVQALNRFKTK